MRRCNKGHNDRLIVVWCTLDGKQPVLADRAVVERPKGDERGAYSPSDQRPQRKGAYVDHAGIDTDDDALTKSSRWAEKESAAAAEIGELA